jgi:hypothetical protein
MPAVQLHGGPDAVAVAPAAALSGLQISAAVPNLDSVSSRDAPEPSSRSSDARCEDDRDSNSQ